MNEEMGEAGNGGGRDGGLPTRSASGASGAALFALMLGTALYFHPSGDWNQNSRFDLTRALVERGTVRIDGYHENTGDKALRDGHYYTDKAPLVSVVGVLPYAVARAVPGLPPAWREAVSTHATAALAGGIPTALAAIALARVLVVLGAGPVAGVFVAIVWSLASLALPYSTMLYGHQLSASLLLLAATILILARVHGALTPRASFAAGLLLGASVAAEYPAALAVVVLMLYALAVIRPWRPLAWCVAGGAVVAVLLGGYHAVAFGSPAALAYDFSTQPHRHLGWFMGLGAPRREALAGILWSAYRGGLRSMPWLVLAVPGAVVLWRRGWRAEVLSFSAIVVAFVWMNASLVDWEGGWAMGPRYLIPALPFAAALAAGVLVPPRPSTDRVTGATAAAWIVFVLLGLFAVAAMLVGTAVAPQVPFHFQRPFEDALLPAFRRGLLAVNIQCICPYPIRGDPRQAWNVGHLLGLEGLRSLLPLAAWAAATAAWLVIALRAEARPTGGGGGVAGVRPSTPGVRGR